MADEGGSTRRDGAVAQIRGDGLFGLFSDGMTLANDCADFLERYARRAMAQPAGSGQAGRDAVLRLTVQVRAISRWLVLQRAANRGEMTIEAARSRQREAPLPPAATAPDAGELPPELAGLVARANRLQSRIERIRDDLESRSAEPGAGAVERRLQDLRSALTRT